MSYFVKIVDSIFKTPTFNEEKNYLVIFFHPFLHRKALELDRKGGQRGEDTQQRTKAPQLIFLNGFFSLRRELQQLVD